MRSFDENLRLYAKLAVREGVALAPGQELILSAEIDQAPLVRLVAEEAYRAGAKNVEILWRDSEVAKIRYREGSEEAINYAPAWQYQGVAEAHREGAARLGISSSDPQMLGEFPPEKVGRASRAQSAAARPVSELISAMAMNWCVIGAASPDWAKRVFPDLSPEEATAKLWEKIFLASRVLEADPVEAWITHSARLESRVEWLNSLRVDALHFRGPGTDLTIGLVENHLWAGGRGVAKNGVRCSPNIPTEEVFTMPHRGRVNGTVTATLPLSLRGQVVEGITVRFVDGRIEEAHATSGEATLLQLLDTDDGARRLGEVALVPNSSKVRETETLFFNTLYDENAASHIALGACYAENLAGYDDLSPEDRLTHGANDSLIHVDWMIGSGQVDVDGLAADGLRTPIMRAGEWVD